MLLSNRKKSAKSNWFIIKEVQMLVVCNTYIAKSNPKVLLQPHLDYNLHQMYRKTKEKS